MSRLQLNLPQKLGRREQNNDNNNDLTTTSPVQNQINPMALQTRPSHNFTNKATEGYEVRYD
ncbi:hypothetical protein INR49_006082 [Caranx melampygus]|nr:hypothetical protein INR49_006082 [Caranx melampygus]